MTTSSPNPYKGYRFPAEINSHCVWLYYTFPLSYRDIEKMMLYRGIEVTYETIAIRDYKTRIDHDAYDDERTHTTYGYRVTIQIGDYSEHIEILTQRVYSPVEHHLYTLLEQLDYYVEDEVAGLLRQQAMEDVAKTQLAREIGYLLGCAARLLALTPQTVQFQYPGAEVAA